MHTITHIQTAIRNTPSSMHLVELLKKKKKLDIKFKNRVFICIHLLKVPTGSPSVGGDVAVYIFYINQVSLPTPFYSVLMSVSVFAALSTVFHSINCPDNSPLSHSVLPILFPLPYWSFQLHLSL